MEKPFEVDCQGCPPTSEGLEVCFRKNGVLDGDFAKVKAGTRAFFKEEPGEQGPPASTG